MMLVRALRRTTFHKDLTVLGGAARRALATANKEAAPPKLTTEEEIVRSELFETLSSSRSEKLIENKPASTLLRPYDQDFFDAFPELRSKANMLKSPFNDESLAPSSYSSSNAKTLSSNEGTFLSSGSKKQAERTINLAEQEITVGTVISVADLPSYIPEGVPNDIRFIIGADEGLLLRESIADVIDSLNKQKRQGFSSKPLLIHGSPGTGKTTALLLSTYWARRDGWLVFYVPDANALNMGAITHSTIELGMFDQNSVAQNLLRRFIDCEEDKLKKINLKLSDYNLLPGFNAPRETKFDERYERERVYFEETAPKPTLSMVQDVRREDAKSRPFTPLWQKPAGNDHPHKTLLDLCVFGSRSQNHYLATEAFLWLRRELNYVTEYNVLLAIDNVNRISGPSEFADPEHHSFGFKMIDSSRLTIVKSLFDLNSHGMLNGTALYATSGTYTQKYLRVPESTELRFVESFTPKEFEEHCSHLSQEEGDFGLLTREFIYQSTGGRPKLFRKQILSGFHGKYN